MYRSVPREQIAAAVAHLRELFRGHKPANEQEYRSHEKREVVSKNLLSNLFRTGEHPTLNSVLEVADIFSLTLDGAHRLFGYELESLREYDLNLNSGRTHIIESYPFARDLAVDVPAVLGTTGEFERDTTLRDIVPAWQASVPIRSLQTPAWQESDVFYVRIGTEDSLGSSLPPGAVALVAPVDEAERQRPNPRSIYLLQFGNGYRCSRCVVTRGKLLLLTSGRKYNGPQEFSYPERVRIAGKIRMFALKLPIPEYSPLHSLPTSNHVAPLTLPWEHASLDRLFAAKHRRFVRSRIDRLRVKETMEEVLHSKISTRTERRYRHPTASRPHVDALLHLSVAHITRYTDALRVQRSMPSERGRYPLEMLLNAQRLDDLKMRQVTASSPRPTDRWAALRNQFVEWPMLLSLRFPELRAMDEQIVRLAHGCAVQGFDPPLAPGSLILLGKIHGAALVDAGTTKPGWTRQLYAFRRGSEFICGYVDRRDNKYVFLSEGPRPGESIFLEMDDLHSLSYVAGVAVPL